MGQALTPSINDAPTNPTAISHPIYRNCNRGGDPSHFNQSGGPATNPAAP